MLHGGNADGVQFSGGERGADVLERHGAAHGNLPVVAGQLLRAFGLVLDNGNVQCRIERDSSGEYRRDHGRAVGHRELGSTEHACDGGFDDQWRVRNGDDERERDADQFIECTRILRGRAIPHRDADRNVVLLRREADQERERVCRGGSARVDRQILSLRAGTALGDDKRDGEVHRLHARCGDGSGLCGPALLCARNREILNPGSQNGERRHNESGKLESLQLCSR